MYSRVMMLVSEVLLCFEGYSNNQCQNQTLIRVSTLMYLFHALSALIQCSINSGCHGQCATNNGTYAHKEARKAFASRLAVDNLHGRDVLDCQSALWL